jgi:hypothetical protein
VHADLDDLVIALYCFVDDLFGPRLGPGRRPKLSDSELVCLAIAQVLLAYPTERRWLRAVGQRLGHLFPYIPNQSGYNKRLRAAAHLVVLVLHELAVASPSWCDQFRLLDATPLPCGTSRQTAKRSALWPHAGYGYCKSHSRWYWGFKLYVLTTPDGMPVNWCLATPKLGERQVAAALLSDCTHPGQLGRIIVCDKGFAGHTFERLVAGLGAAVIRPDRKGEPRRFGPLGGMRQWVESIIDTSKASLGWSNTAAASLAGCLCGWRSGCSPWPHVCGSTGCLASPTSAPWSPTTTETSPIQSESIV